MLIPIGTRMRLRNPLARLKHGWPDDSLPRTGSWPVVETKQQGEPHGYVRLFLSPAYSGWGVAVEELELVRPSNLVKKSPI